MRLLYSQSEPRKDWMLDLFKLAGLGNKKNTNYQFWIQNNHPVELDSNQLIEQKLNYIHNNPVIAGIVNDAEHYIYSSASAYAGELTKMQINFV